MTLSQITAKTDNAVRPSAMTLREVDAPPQQPRIAWSIVAATGALSTVIGVLALVTAPGATTTDGTTYDTTFVTKWVWWLALSRTGFSGGSELTLRR